MILAYLAGAEVERDNVGFPLRITTAAAGQAVGDIRYKVRSWPLNESTLSTPAVVAPPLLAEPGLAVAEYTLFRDGAKNTVTQKLADAVEQGFGLRNPDRDSTATIPAGSTTHGVDTRASQKPPMTTVFVGANDMLHAFRAGPNCAAGGLIDASASVDLNAVQPTMPAGCSELGGEELWGFVPYDQLAKVKDLLHSRDARSAHLHDRLVDTVRRRVRARQLQQVDRRRHLRRHRRLAQGALLRPRRGRPVSHGTGRDGNRAVHEESTHHQRPHHAVEPRQSRHQRRHGRRHQEQQQRRLQRLPEDGADLVGAVDRLDRPRLQRDPARRRIRLRRLRRLGLQRYLPGALGGLVFGRQGALHARRAHRRRGGGDRRRHHARRHQRLPERNRRAAFGLQRRHHQLLGGRGRRTSVEGHGHAGLLRRPARLHLEGELREPGHPYPSRRPRSRGPAFRTSRSRSRPAPP